MGRPTIFRVLGLNPALVDTSNIPPGTQGLARVVGHHIELITGKSLLYNLAENPAPTPAFLQPSPGHSGFPSNR